ncbi:MAG: hypothetical protein U1E65_18325 [Myxococcota bacterium]
MIPLALLLLAAPPPAIGTAPQWEKNEVKSLFMQAEAAGSAPNEELKDAELARVIGGAYRLQAIPNETVDNYCKRIVKRRDPAHPDVKKGSWVMAAGRLFYADLSVRAATLSRVEIDRNDRLFLESKGGQAKAVADYVAGQLMTKVEGAEGFMSPMPVGAGEPTTKFGCDAIVRNDKIEVNQLERIKFIENNPKPDAPRTGTGALRELVASMKDWNIKAETIGKIDPVILKGDKILRIFAPAAYPSTYLNELMRAAKEASMKQILVMVTDKADGKLREIPLVTEAPASKPQKGKKAATFVDVKCKDGESIQVCVDRMVEARKDGALVFRVE